MAQTPNLAEFKQFAADIAPAARAVLMARAFAAVEAERVNAYILPIFDTYRFTVKKDRRMDPNAEEVITDPKNLYLSDQADDLRDYFEECDQAHRQHGFTGPHGHCPALIAENLAARTEQQLIDLAAPFFGIKVDMLYGRERAKFLDLIIGACLKSERLPV